MEGFVEECFSYAFVPVLFCYVECGDFSGLWVEGYGSYGLVVYEGDVAYVVLEFVG